MAFIYCETCDWQQDDFWTWKYNPVRCFFRRIRDYGWPRMVHFDIKSSYGNIHSWRVLLCEIAKLIRRVAQMQWRTAKTWQKVSAEKWPHCPRCGNNSLNID